ncbi:MAG: hypothetical protein ACE5PV_01460 [Candidatus Poribacteria bacterium]
MRRESKFRFIAYIFGIFLLLNISAYMGEAVREGTANANMMIRRYERKGQFGKAALWREAAAECLNVISIPMTEIMLKYYQRYGNKELAEKSRGELKDIEAQRQEHLRRAKLDREKAKESKEELDAERAKIDKFIAEWAPYYPDRFYQFGFYKNIFENRIALLKKEGKFAPALIMAAEAAEMAAEQYTVVTIAYFTRKAEEAEKAGLTKLKETYLNRAAAYQKVRDNHLKRASMLRALAKQNPKIWPDEADKRDFNVPKSQHKLTEKDVKKLARSDKRVQEILGTPESVLEFASFQGFGWTIAYYTRGWDNLGIAFIDDDTGKVTDVLISPGDLEKRDWDREEQEGLERLRKLKLTPEQVTRIARENEQAARFLKENPDTKTDAAFNWKYNCWIVEFVIDNREVGVVTVSDETREVLEVTVGH